MKIYVASSWRNEYQPDIVKHLVAQGHDVYDFRNPSPGNNGFRWSEIDPSWGSWTPRQYAEALDHPIAQQGFDMDMEGLRGADLCILVLPSGRSASWEYGWHNGRHDRSGIVYMPEKCEPELMYRGSLFATTFDELDAAIVKYEKEVL